MDLTPDGSRSVAAIPIIAVAAILGLLHAATVSAAGYSPFTTLIVLAWLIAVMSKLSGPPGLRATSITGLWSITFVILIFLPALFLANQLPVGQGTFVSAILLVAAVLPLGVIASQLMFRYSTKEASVFGAKPIERPGPESHAWLWAIVTLVLGSALAAKYLSEVGVTPLAAALQGVNEGLTLAHLRESSFKLLDSPLKPLYTLLREAIFPMLVMVCAGHAVTSNERKWKILAVIGFVVAFTYSSLSFARLPPLALTIMTAVCMYQARQSGSDPDPAGAGKKRSAKLLVSLAIVVGLAFPITVTKVTRGTDWSAAVQTVAVRVFIAPARALGYYFEIVPHRLDFQGGRAMGRVVSLFGMEPFDIGNYVSNYIDPNSPISSGSANAAFVGPLYVDFGLVGVVIGSFLIGMIMGTVQIYVHRSRKSVLSVASYAYLVYTFSLLHILPAPSVLFYSGVPLVLVLLQAFGRPRRHRQASRTGTLVASPQKLA